MQHDKAPSHAQQKWAINAERIKAEWEARSHAQNSGQ